MPVFLATSLLLASAVHANVLPRAGISTFTIPFPTQAAPVTTTVSGCDSVDPFVIVGVPTSTATFFPGTRTIYVPPQAFPTQTTIIDTVQNATEVVIVTPLPGTCGELPFPSDTPTPTGTDSATPTPTPDICPEGGCSGEVVRNAQIIINAINKVTLLSQSLQSAAKQIGASPFGKRDGAIAQSPITDVAAGLRNIAATLSFSAQVFLPLPPLPPGCSSDTVIIALIEFVRVHQALLNILIGRAGLLPGGPIKREALIEGDVALDERGDNAFIGAVVAGALRAVESIVDTVAFKLIDLVPTRSECAKNQKAALDASLEDAITAYKG